MEAPKGEISDKKKVQWQWKSNHDVGDKSEKAQWECYSRENNDLIEEAYQKKQEKADLGGYIILFKKMFQINRVDVNAQRPVRRVDWTTKEETSFRSERYSEIESPKNINSLFGDLKDLLYFFTTRNSESFNFSRLLNEIEREKDLKGLNKEIIPLILECLHKELKKERMRRPYSPSERKLIEKEEEFNKMLFSLFKKNFEILSSFFQEILRAYTLTTFLCRNLNKYLREESWIEIDNLLPYAICLCKAFLALSQTELNVDENEIVTLYRGAPLTEAAIDCFDLKNNPLFSWYSATSTSKNRVVAQKFSRRSNRKGEAQEYPVIFIIAVSQKNNKQSKYSRPLDIHSYSAYPIEGEVILPPGSIFKIEGVSKNLKGTTKINLRFKDDTQLLASQGLIMPGKMQTLLMTGKQVNIPFLEGEELCKALKLMFGNKLIEEVEIGTCRFDNISLGELIRTLQTMENIKKLNFVSCSYEDRGEIPDFKMKTQSFKFPRITISESNNFSRIFGRKSNFFNFWKYLQVLEISFTNLDNLSSLPKLRNLTQLASLKLTFSHHDATTDKALSHFCTQGLKSLTKLETLDLDFDQCNKITDKGINRLSEEGLKYLTQLTSLSLNFAKCSKMTDEAVLFIFEKGLINLMKLKSLNLSFVHCTQITDKGINILADVSRRNCFVQLSSLKLNFSGCTKITNQGVKDLMTRTLIFLPQLILFNLDVSECFKLTDNVLNSSGQNLQKLSFLNMNFSGCKYITEDGIKYFFTEEFKYLAQLKFLNCDFSGCKIKAPEEVSTFCSQKIVHLPKIVRWNLNLSRNLKKIPIIETKGFSQQIKNVVARMNQKGLLIDLPVKFIFTRVQNPDEEKSSKSFLRESLPYNLFDKIARTGSLVKVFENKNKQSFLIDLKILEFPNQLRLLTLKFLDCKLLSNGVLNKLCLQSLKHLANLTHLKLDFTGCSKISDKGLKKLTFKCLRTLLRLKFLDLNFSRCFEITDEGFESLCSQGLQHLPHLNSLFLNFEGCREITDQGIYHLSSQALRYLRNVRDLDLNFSKCSKITEKGLNDLYCIGLRHLPQIKSLKLIFYLCWSMEGKIIKNLCEVLQNSKDLRCLMINYFLCSKITDDVVRNFSCQGLTHFTGLKSLSLNFSCSKITDEGMRNLFSGLKSLPQLKYFSLNCEGCEQITDAGVNYLCCQGFRFFRKLKTLALNFKTCPKITDFTKKQLLNISRYFGFTSEKLEF